MSNLISRLADAIIDLINSKPSSPRKEEIMEIMEIMEVLNRGLCIQFDAAMMANYPGFLRTKYNASPHLPRKEQIEALLKGVLTGTATGDRNTPQSRACGRAKP